jgi:ABC-type multidrug transport system fused ATPase/permease subunit
MTKLWTLKHIASNLIEVKRNWWKIGILICIYVIFLASSPYFYKILIDWLEKNITLGNFWGELIVIILIWLATIIGTIGIRYIYGLYLLTIVQKDWGNFLMRSMKMMLQLPIDYHISLQHGEKQKIIDRASEAVWDFWDSGLLHIVPQFLVTIILLISGLMIDVRMTLISMILFPFAIWWIHRLGNTAYQNQRAANKYWDSLFNRIVDTFTNLKVIRIFSREEHEIAVLNSRFSKAHDVQYDIRKFWLVFNWLWEFISTLAQAITLSAGIYFIIDGTINLGTLFFFIGFTEKIYGPIFIIFQKFQETLIHIAWYEKMQLLYAMNPEKDSGKKEFTGIKKSLTFKNVSFTYPSTTREVLKWVNIEVKKWEKIALIGHTGSGKSTIVQLLMRFYDYTTGRIEIDGENIEEFTLESYRSKFASVFQDTTLFNESIRHNLEYIRDGVTEKTLRKACKEANILDFIESLPEWWETEVGERGLKLSGGEKQRIAIARAILADPEILILDEATSALDTETERLIQDSLEKLMEGRTSIIIAHRLSTIQHVDRIYMLDGGEVIASGSHAELMESSEKYRHLIELQHDGFIDEEEVENS